MSLLFQCITTFLIGLAIGHTIYHSYDLFVRTKRGEMCNSQYYRIDDYAMACESFKVFMLYLMITASIVVICWVFQWWASIGMIIVWFILNMLVSIHASWWNKRIY